MDNNDLKNLFVKSKIKNSNNKSITIANTAQNLYLNQQPKETIKLKSIVQETLKKNEEESDVNESESETDIENEDEEEEEEEEEEENEDKESGSEDETEEETETEKEKESEVEQEIGAVETDYNEEKDSENINNEDDCLYDYDDEIDNTDFDIKQIEVVNNERITDIQLTHYEKVRLLGIRAKQISMGAKVMVKHDTSMSAIELAKYELNNKTTPLIIKRPLPNNTYELWKVSELQFNDDNSEIIIDNLNKSFNIDYAIN